MRTDFFLAQSDLSLANVMVDEKESITRIIDWGFACTLPCQAAEDYPYFLADEENFIGLTEEIYNNPLSELRDWREFHTNQFDGDSAMEDTTIAFEKILCDNSEATIEALAEKFKFLESTSAFGQMNLGYFVRLFKNLKF